MRACRVVLCALADALQSVNGLPKQGGSSFHFMASAYTTRLLDSKSDQRNTGAPALHSAFEVQEHVLLYCLGSLTFANNVALPGGIMALA